MRNRRFHVLWVTLVFALGACASVDRDPTSKLNANQLQEMGEKFLSAGDVGQSIKYLSMAEQKRPKDPTIQYFLGLAYGARGLQNEAAAKFQAAVQLKPDYSEAYNALGALYAEQGQYDLAVQDFEKALANPTYDTPYYAMFNLGRIYEKRGDLESALKQYREAVRLQPNYGTAYYQMGQVLEALHRKAEARDAYGNAIENSPDLVEAHLRYGIMCYEAGELEHALYSLSRVVKLSPHSTMATEAKRYLERLQGIVRPDGSKVTHHVASDKQLAQMEVEEVRNAGKNSGAALPKAKASKVTQKTHTGFEQGQVHDAMKPSAGSTDDSKESSKAPASPTQYTYLVQVASFLDRENAEDVVKRLKSSGFDVILRPHTHQVLGQIYVVQLKPFSDNETAKNVVSQLETLEEVKPVIIKVPVGN